jgi:hypothetical protein
MPAPHAAFSSTTAQPRPWMMPTSSTVARGSGTRSARTTAATTGRPRRHGVAPIHLRFRKQAGGVPWQCHAAILRGRQLRMRGYDWGRRSSAHFSSFMSLFAYRFLYPPHGLIPIQWTALHHCSSALHANMLLALGK